MFPVIRSHVVRGTQELPRIVHVKRVEVIPLPSMEFASLLVACDGEMSVSDIAMKFHITEESLLVFLQKMTDIGIVRFSDFPERAPVSMHLGVKEPWLSEVHLDITDRCNLAKHCPHCYRGETLNQKSEQSSAKWRGLIDALVDMGTYRIALSGGEPFLRKDLLEIVEYAISKQVLVSGIFTNGTIDPSRADRVLKMLADHGVHTALYVSMDGPDALINDRYRGKGSFQKTIRFIEHVRDCYSGSSLSVTVNSQVNVHNVLLLLPWYDAMKRLGIIRWRMNAGRMTGRLLEHSELVVSANQLAEAYELLIEKHVADWRAGTLPFGLNIEGFFRTNMLTRSRAYIFDENLSICDYKKNACSIEPNGDVSFCTSWGSRHFGNVFSGRMEDIWYGRELQTLKSMRIKEITECRGCEFLRFCGGGCRLVAKTLSSRDPVSCDRYRIFSDRIAPILERAGVSFVVE